MKKEKFALSDEAISQVSGGTQVPHIVQSGESMSALARKYGCTVDDICKWNQIESKDANNLAVGQKLFIKF